LVGVTQLRLKANLDYGPILRRNRVTSPSKLKKSGLSLDFHVFRFMEGVSKPSGHVAIPVA
jgi:hypothetical protein